MKALYSTEGVRMLGREVISFSVPQRQVMVQGLGDFWGEAIATAILSLCFLANEWAGFSVRRLREEMDKAMQEGFRASWTQFRNAEELRRVRGERINIVLVSVLSLGLWPLVCWLSGKGIDWPRYRHHPEEVPHLLPVPFSPQGLDWLLEHGYVRREGCGEEAFIYPEPKLVRETRCQWELTEDD